ncbi:piggyBac transposable element-derived protein 4-like isoform X1 [Bactrocera dorsalis]|uniref:PiggyBac transposable element-derived protein 4-like isoform X1 n=1 Tax=Bactrocera dorsalis TaxID=27457 RepID=A0ABM3K4S1_BACDO|nr:piggyBac transposable element-derived protein 4-like isoform X1 [Bactrocera dorsalis]
MFTYEMAHLNEDEIREVLCAESVSDISDCDIDYNSENYETNESETDSEPEPLLTPSGSVDSLFIAKNKMVWSATPLPQHIGSAIENIISTQPGPTRFAVSRCHDIVSAFLLFFPPPIEKIVIENTNKYDRVKFDDKWGDIDDDILCRGKNEDVHGLFDSKFGRPIFRSIMSENHFHKITSALRFDDVLSRQQTRSSDKFAPIRDLWDRWQQFLPMFYNCHENVTVDEQLVAFRGRCSFRQFMPSKPAKYGLKFWLSVDSKSGYVWKIQPYLGKPRNAKPEKNQGERVALDLTDDLKGQNITADNFFSTFELVKKLHERKLTYVGTVRKNKTFIPPKLLTVKNLPLYKSTFAFNDIATLVSYISHKNKATILISTIHKKDKVDESGPKKKPEIVSYYNSTKGLLQIVFCLPIIFYVSYL